MRVRVSVSVSVSVSVRARIPVCVCVSVCLSCLRVMACLFILFGCCRLDAAGPTQPPSRNLCDGIDCTVGVCISAFFGPFCVCPQSAPDCGKLQHYLSLMRLALLVLCLVLEPTRFETDASLSSLSYSTALERCCCCYRLASFCV